ncbi:MAG TPA: hypothetical protein VFA94_10745 [Acidimicrobiales bacterium]|nr:hypothetical protein [Acidimicrobiales bacterium]
MPTTEATTEAADDRVATASGAKVRPIPPDTATTFLARVGEPAFGTITVAFGAHEDDGTLIGVAVLGARTRYTSSRECAGQRVASPSDMQSRRLGELGGNEHA